MQRGSRPRWAKGTGIAHVEDGRIWGHDSITTYSGSCEIDGDRFTAILSIRRHTEAHATVFGADDLTLRLEGTCADKLGRYTATAEQVPGVILEGTLILSEPQLPAPEPIGPTPKFDPDKLPKPPTRTR